MQVEMYFPTDNQVSKAIVMFKALESAKAISRKRAIVGNSSILQDKQMSVDACLRTVVGCHTFEQLKTASNYCSLVLERMYPFPVKATSKEELSLIEGQRDSISKFFREKLLQKAKELTPYLSEIPEEELAEILWN